MLEMIKNFIQKIKCLFGHHDFIFISGPHYYVEGKDSRYYYTSICSGCRLLLKEDVDARTKDTNNYVKYKGKI